MPDNYYPFRITFFDNTSILVDDTDTDSAIIQAIEKCVEQGKRFNRLAVKKAEMLTSE